MLGFDVRLLMFAVIVVLIVVTLWVASKAKGKKVRSILKDCAEAFINMALAVFR